MADLDLEPLIDHYCRILAPLFEYTGDLFDYVLALLRATALEGAGWDTLSESFRMLADLQLLATADLPPDHFERPEHTRLRLNLLEYCHFDVPCIRPDHPKILQANAVAISD